MVPFRFTRNLAVGIVSVVLLTVMGCKNNSTSPDTASAVTTDDAADVIAASLGGSSSTNGVAAQAASAATVAGGSAVSASVVDNDVSAHQTMMPSLLRMVSSAVAEAVDTTITAVKTTGSYTYDYTLRFQYGFTNDSTLGFTYSMHGTYDTPRMSSADSATAAWTVTHIRPASTSYTLNGSYTRNGSQASKVRNKNSLTTTITLTLTDVDINKTTKLITSGTATGTFTGNTTGGKVVQYAFTITFTGNQSATIMVNGSSSYTVDMTTGQTN